MNRSSWTDDDRNEFDLLVMESWHSSSNQASRTDEFLHRLRDAEQAQRYFARDVLHDAERRGAAAILKSAQKSNSLVMGSHDGQLLAKPRMIGTQRKDLNGRAYYEQTLFDLMTWEELTAKRSEYLKQIETYDASVATMDKLLALRDLAPGAANPKEAAERLGTTVEHWLGQSEVA